jgi:hypothetical protein
MPFNLTDMPSKYQHLLDLNVAFVSDLATSRYKSFHSSILNHDNPFLGARPYLRQPTGKPSSPVGSTLKKKMSIMSVDKVFILYFSLNLRTITL